MQALFKFGYVLITLHSIAIIIIIIILVIKIIDSFINIIILIIIKVCLDWAYAEYLLIS